MSDEELKALVALGREASDYLTEHNVEFPNKPSLYRELAEAVELLMQERDAAILRAESAEKDAEYQREWANIDPFD